MNEKKKTFFTASYLDGGALRERRFDTVEDARAFFRRLAAEKTEPRRLSGPEPPKSRIEELNAQLRRLYDTIGGLRTRVDEIVRLEIEKDWWTSRRNGK